MLCRIAGIYLHWVADKKHVYVLFITSKYVTRIISDVSILSSVMAVIDRIVKFKTVK